MSRSEPTLSARLTAEFVGTGLLLAVIVGSGIVVSRDGSTGINALFPHALAVGVGLAILIYLFQPISGAQFNPAVTLCAWASRLLSWRHAVVYIAAQIAGGTVGAYATDRLFRDEPFTLATTQRAGTDLFVSELFATATLLLVIFLLVRNQRVTHLAVAVGGWIFAAVLFTPSAAFANPAVAIARIFTESYTGISAPNVPAFVLAQLLAVPVALAVLHLLTPAKTPAVKRKGPMMENHTPTVLFLCVHNAGRSQMAAAFTQALGGAGINVLSGGSDPAAHVNPLAVQVMDERGINLTQNTPARWTNDDLERADVIVTMGCGDTCPVLPGKRYLDWDLDDPAGQDVTVVRGIRDAIESKVEGLLSDLDVTR